MPADHLTVYAALARAFDAVDVRWYLVGARAAILHGVSRFSEDVDVTVDPAGREVGDLIEALGDQAFALQVDDSDFIRQTSVLPLYHRPTDTPVDVILASSGIEALFLEAAIEIELDGVPVPVARPEDLIVMKILAGRHKDVDDVEAILRAQGDRFDDARVRDLLGQLEAALSQSDLLPLFERCRHRAGG